MLEYIPRSSGFKPGFRSGRNSTSQYSRSSPSNLLSKFLDRDHDWLKLGETLSPFVVSKHNLRFQLKEPCLTRCHEYFEIVSLQLVQSLTSQIERTFMHRVGCTLYVDYIFRRLIVLH